MKILSRYVFREIISSAVLGTLLATFVVFLQGRGKELFEILARSSTDPSTVLRLFLLALPRVLPLTIPFGVLVGILIGLGRMATDGEITAMRAAGVSSRIVAPPVLLFAFIATLLAGAASLWLTPMAIRGTFKILNRIAAEQLTAEVQPRVFDEQFPNKILYVEDVIPGPLVIWKNVFVADLTPPDQRNSGLKEQGEGPMITIAREAIAVPDVKNNRIQLSLRDVSTHEVAKNAVGRHAVFPRGEQILEASAPSEKKPAHVFTEMGTPELWRFTRTAPRQSDESVEARIELNSRLALPLACMFLGLVGIPLGVSSRKGGKSAGYVWAIFLAFFCYYMSFISLSGLAQRRLVPVELAAWLPNAGFGIAGIILLAGLERPGGRDVLGAVGAAISFLARRIKRLFVAPSRRPAGERVRPGIRFLLIQIVDTYILTNFLFYFVLLLSSFVLMAEVYNFFELLSHIVRNKIPMARVFTYLAFLTPKLIYDTLPISVLMAVLVTFSVLTKHNEVTAFKACGVSVRRLGLPVLLFSGVLSAGLFAFDHYYIPEANLKQDAIRNEILNRPVQTYLRPDRKWIFGSGHNRIYYYKYFDTVENVMAGVNVYEIEPVSFALKREIAAERAQWQPALHTWVFQNGWSRDVKGVSETNVKYYQVTTFPELNESPNYFLKEVKQDKQMNYLQLQRYIKDLQQSGFDTVRLRVQLYKKFSVPLFALIMAMISIPFGFLVGNRGAMAGIGVSIGIAMAYWGVGQLFEQIGDVNQLPPAVAAWAPDALFSLAGMYLLLRMRS
ncbi:MAG: LptF/LptG family permease [Bryobacteraceae bacterium]